MFPIYWTGWKRHPTPSRSFRTMLLLLITLSLSWSQMPTSGEVVGSFQDHCPQFFLRETPPLIRLPPRPVRICQRYQNLYRFATLYDKDNRIPVYSAYVYNPGQAKRPKKWMVEPQLINSTFQREMETEGDFLNKKGPKEALCDSQAILNDYKNLTDCNRGHLNPNGHQPNYSAKSSTFTLTNIVPQFIKLNGGAWNNYEQTTMLQMTKGCQETFALVGAVPGDTYIAGGRVNRPSHMWSAACCVIDNNHLRSWGILARNDQNVVQKFTLGQLEAQLAELYNVNRVSLFHRDCPRQ
ncbi:endonuclease domain-containing 1 protein-like isoform X1 [Pantherophis guttatus]|uniref:Endonuclease domain-containing 1 protein-like isoform X1 n=2 Tax=Pantherophis guttatus TaxID=94885 RepID=A0ABM3ZHE7_PANGU|nr:endonuclease domain-containing 1 protein-like isoform X1 [Pantherophis guttatus]